MSWTINFRPLTNRSKLMLKTNAQWSYFKLFILYWVQFYFLLVGIFKYMFMYLLICRYVPTFVSLSVPQMRKCSQNPEEYIISSADELRDRCMPLDVGARNRTQILWKTSKCSQPWSHLSTPIFCSFLWKGDVLIALGLWNWSFFEKD